MPFCDFFLTKECRIISGKVYQWKNCFRQIVTKHAQELAHCKGRLYSSFGTWGWHYYSCHFTEPGSTLLMLRFCPMKVCNTREFKWEFPFFAESHMLIAALIQKLSQFWPELISTLVWVMINIYLFFCINIPIQGKQASQCLLYKAFSVLHQLNLIWDSNQQTVARICLRASTTHRGLIQPVPRRRGIPFSFEIVNHHTSS